MPETSYSPGPDVGGRTYTAAQVSFYGPDHLRWCWPEHELGDLAKAQCSLEWVVENLETALGDFEHTGTRPAWVRESKALLRRARRLLEQVNAEVAR